MASAWPPARTVSNPMLPKPEDTARGAFAETASGLRVAIVGCGRMGGQRARASAALGATVVLSDRSSDTARRLAAEIGPGATTVAGALPWSDLDAVFVCTPAGERGAVEASAAAAGVPVMVEKPIALSAATAQPIVASIRAGGVLNAVGYMNRYRDSVSAVRRALAAQPVFAAHCHWVGDPYAKDWWLDPAVSGGPFTDQASHLLDLCRYLVGEITEVSVIGRASEDGSPVADVLAVAMRFATGACGTLLYSFRSADKHVTARFFSAEACHSLEGWDFRLAHEPEQPRVPRDQLTPIFLTETRAFLAAVAGGPRDAIRSDVLDAYRTIKVVDAVHRSLRTGGAQPVAGDDP
jgi:myo-inositol 2-dehydrogenase / D-chiro-inositol 1-dehydrogenase